MESIVTRVKCKRWAKISFMCVYLCLYVYVLWQYDEDCTKALWGVFVTADSVFSVFPRSCAKTGMVDQPSLKASFIYLYFSHLHNNIQIHLTIRPYLSHISIKKVSKIFPLSFTLIFQLFLLSERRNVKKTKNKICIHKFLFFFVSCRPIFLVLVNFPWIRWSFEKR